MATTRCTAASGNTISPTGACAHHAALFPGSIFPANRPGAPAMLQVEGRAPGHRLPSPTSYQLPRMQGSVPIYLGSLGPGNEGVWELPLGLADGPSRRTGGTALSWTHPEQGSRAPGFFSVGPTCSSQGPFQNTCDRAADPHRIPHSHACQDTGCCFYTAWHTANRIRTGTQPHRSGHSPQYFHERQDLSALPAVSQTQTAPSQSLDTVWDRCLEQTRKVSYSSQQAEKAPATLAQATDQRGFRGGPSREHSGASISTRRGTVCTPCSKTMAREGEAARRNSGWAQVSHTPGKAGRGPEPDWPLPSRCQHPKLSRTTGTRGGRPLLTSGAGSTMVKVGGRGTRGLTPVPGVQCSRIFHLAQEVRPRAPCCQAL